MSKKARRMLVLLLIILKEAGPTAACSSSCSSDCDCSNKGLSNVPQDLPTTITRLYLYSNTIRTLSQSDFSRYRSLTTLDLTNNQVSVIHNNTFHNLTNLTMLYLGDNHLTSLTDGMFVGLGKLGILWLHNNQLSSLPATIFVGLDTLRLLWLHKNLLKSLPVEIFVGLDNLKWLALHSNNIHSIEAGTFNDTTQLRYLDLHHNSISTITADTLGNLLQLQKLRLSGNNMNTFPVEALSNLNISALSELTLDNNQLETLPPMAYDILANISTVNIDNNPWQCDCRMAPFKQKMNGFYLFENQIRCARPANLKLQNLRDVNPEDLIGEETTPFYPSTGPPFSFQSTMTSTDSDTGLGDVGSVVFVPLLATLWVIFGLIVICTIAFAVWYMYNWRKRDPTSLQGFSNTNPTGTSNGNYQIRLQTNAEINTQSETPHPDTEDSKHICNLPTDEDPDTAEYNTIDEVNQSESSHRGAGNRLSLDSFGLLVLPPPPLPPQNQTRQMQQFASDDDYEYPSPFLYPGESPQSHKYVNSQVTAAAKDATASHIGSFNDDYEFPSPFLYPGEGPQSHKYESSHATAAAKDAEADPRDGVYGYENDEESVDTQSQTAAAPGADSSHHYEPLRNPSSQQQHTYTSLVNNTSSEPADG